MYRNVSDIQKRRKISKIKGEAKMTQETPSTIIARATISLPVSVAGALPRSDYLSRMIRRTRKANSSAPSSPASLSELNIPTEYTKSLADENFFVVRRWFCSWK